MSAAFAGIAVVALVASVGLFMTARRRILTIDVLEPDPSPTVARPVIEGYAGSL